MQKLVNRLRQDYPDLTFVASESFYWSPRKNTVHFREQPESEQASWPLLHEVGHALLEHQRFTSDFELLQLEVEAWERAKKLAKKYGYQIDENHVQDCLDTYRDWLYKRSTCPQCTNTGLQIEPDIYSCFNCNNTWQVSASRKCRTYRKAYKK